MSANPAARRLSVALVATLLVALVEVAGGLASHSLALLSDAAHVAMDVVALGIALAASIGSTRPANAEQTFGFARFEILAALANGALLSAVTVLVVVEALRRLGTPVAPAGFVMTSVATFGLVVNVGAGLYLHRAGLGHAGHTHDDDHDHDHDHGPDLNVRSAILHLAGDALGAFTVIVGGIAIALTHQAWIDPALALVVAVIIALGVVRVAREATHVLLESAPAHASTPVVRDRMRAIPGVVDVHDLHVWTIGTGSHAIAAHVVVDDAQISEATLVLRAIEAELRARFSITHVTLQFECENCGPESGVVCTQAAPTFFASRGGSPG